ncbi:MAG TPA: DNA gyrase subunit A [Oscillospiraceae bacterium]|nr:DNA gyrase subunit A [Oscillospiraceae bacterium]
MIYLQHVDNNNGKLILIDIEKEMKKSFLEYSMSVIVSRALPDVRDGLKPVHRRIIYTLHEKGLTPDKPYHKSADTVGSVLGSFHPHGDQSVYDALVRLAQSFSLRYPLVDGHGNFGNMDGDPPAAYRYTEARMSKIALEMLTDINKDTVDFVPNYDDRLKEPSVLPSRFPNLIVNGSVGIAVGMATNIPPHNLGEVVDAIDFLMENPDAGVEALNQIIKGPDFPTGGIIMGRSGIRSAYATGRGKITLRAKAEIEEYANGKQRIVFTEIPYMVNKSRLIVAIAELHKQKRIEGIHDLRDESDKEGLRIVVELKRDANPQVVLNRLYTYTQLQDTVGVIMLALVNNEPKVLTLKEMLEKYIEHQVNIITRRTEFDLRKARERAHILEGYVIALDNIDEVIRILRSSKTIPEGKARLIERFAFTDIQADAIVAMRLGQLTGLERGKIEDEYEALKLKIEDFIDILANESRVHNIIKTELEDIRRRFADKRKTEIQEVSGEVDVEDLIPVEESVVTLTDIGYIKRQPVDAYKTQNRGGRGVQGMKQRDEDFVSEMFICSTHDDVLFITDRGIMYKLRCYEIPEGSKQARGINIVNILPLEQGEQIAAMIRCAGFEEGKFITIVTKKGLIKRTKLTAYKNVRKNGLIAIRLNEGDEIAGVRMTDGNAQLIVATNNGRALRMEESKMRPLSRTARGVKAIRLREGDRVVGMARVREDAFLLTVTDKGFGRLSEIESYRTQNRGGYGLLNYKVDEARGDVCSIKVVDSDEDIILISSDGIIIRIRVDSMRVMSRYAKGVRVMRLQDDARVVAFTRAEHDEEQEITEIEALDEDDEAQALAEEQAEVIEEDTAPEDDDIEDDVEELDDEEEDSDDEE